MDKRSTIDLGLAFLGAFALTAGILVLYWWGESRAKALLHKCSQEHGFEILNSKELFFTSGPFGWGTSGRASVFRLRVRDRDGKERTVWVRCGSFFAGLIFDSTTEIEWEDAE